MSLIVASMFNQPIEAVTPPVSYGGFDPASATGSVSFAEANHRATLVAMAAGRDNAGVRGIGSKQWTGTSSFCFEIDVVANDPSYPPMFHVGFIEDGFDFPATFSSYSPADVFQVWRSNGDAFPGAGGVVFTDGDVMAVKLQQAPVLQADATFALYKNGALITTVACNIEGGLRPFVFSLYQEGIQARIHTNPTDMTHFASYGADDGWPA